MFRKISSNTCRKCLNQFCANKLRNVCTKDKMFKPVSKRCEKSVRKITVVGLGEVGMACIMNILQQKVTHDLCLIDANKEKVHGEKLDLLHGSVFLHNTKVVGSTDYKASANSHLCIIAAGAHTNSDRLKMTDSSFKVMQEIVPKVLEHSPEVIFLVATNPCDIMSYAIWKMAKLPTGRVIGTGTLLDSARFRYFISERLGVAPSDCMAYIIGEHGASAVPCWSSVMVGGILLRSINPDIGCPDDEERWNELHEEVVSAGKTVRTNKGYTSWAIGLTATEICMAIFENSNRVLPVSTLAKDFHGIKDEVFLSLPCVLNKNGVTAVVKQKLDRDEVEALQKSACILLEHQNKLKIS